MALTLTWADRVANLRASLQRQPTLEELLLLAPLHDMTPEEIAEQRRSFVRGMTARCEHGELDFEQCPQCRSRP